MKEQELMPSYPPPSDRAEHLFDRFLAGETLSTQDIVDDYDLASTSVGPLLRDVRDLAKASDFNVCTTSRGRIPGAYYLSQSFAPTTNDEGSNFWIITQALSAITRTRTSKDALEVCYTNIPTNRRKTLTAKALQEAISLAADTITSLETMVCGFGVPQEVGV